MEYVAGASGAALGYIHGNVRGAVKGYYLGKKLYQNSRMAPAFITSGRTTSRTPRKRKVAVDAAPLDSGVRKRLRSYSLAKRSAARRVAPVGSSKSNDVKVTNKLPKKKLVKKVKISKKFKKQVAEALKGTKPTGTFEEKHYGYVTINQMARTFGFGYNHTYVTPLANDTDSQKPAFAYAGNLNWSFTNFKFCEFLDAAQVLFFNKIARLYNTGGTLIQNYEARAEQPWDYYNTEVQQWDYNGLLDTPFKVIDSSVQYTFKNNYQRTITMYIHKCQPKTKIGAKPFGDYQSLGMFIDAYAEWQHAIDEETQALQGGGATSSIYDPKKLNAMFIRPVNNHTLLTPPYTIRGYDMWHTDSSPKQHPMMTSKWNIGTIKVTLEPGQTYTYYSQGPKNCMFNAKQWAVYNNNGTVRSGYDTKDYAQKKPGWSEDIIICLLPELLAKSNATADAVGRFGENLNEGQKDHMVAVECVKKFKLEMPETTGGMVEGQDLGGASKVTPKFMSNTNRKRVKYFADYVYGTLPGAATQAQRVDDNNPVTETNVS